MRLREILLPITATTIGGNLETRGFLRRSRPSRRHRLKPQQSAFRDGISHTPYPCRIIRKPSTPTMHHFERDNPRNRGSDSGRRDELAVSAGMLCNRYQSKDFIDHPPTQKNRALTATPPVEKIAIFQRVTLAAHASPFRSLIAKVDISSGRP